MLDYFYGPQADLLVVSRIFRKMVCRLGSVKDFSQNGLQTLV